MIDAVPPNMVPLWQEYTSRVKHRIIPYIY
jgi:hypothetical protein